MWAKCRKKYEHYKKGVMLENQKYEECMEDWKKQESCTHNVLNTQCDFGQDAGY